MEVHDVDDRLHAVCTLLREKGFTVSAVQSKSTVTTASSTATMAVALETSRAADDDVVQYESFVPDDLRLFLVYAWRQ